MEQQTLEQPVELPLLSQEERNDLRKKVLAGIGLTKEEARRVFETLRKNQASAIAASDRPKKERKGKKAMSDAELDDSLKALGL